MFLHSCLIPTHRRLIPLNFSISKKKTVAKKRTQMSPLVRTESKDLQKAESVENYHKKYIYLKWLKMASEIRESGLVFTAF